jgi:hypothetical protein
MKVPDVSPMQFAALAVLLNGRVHRNGKIARAIGHHRPDSFTIVLHSLRARGLIERVRWWPAPGEPGAGGQRQLRGYRITQAGRSSWRETLDHYLFFAERFGPGRKRSGDAEGEEPDGVEVEAFEPYAPVSDRKANESEAEAILEAAPPWLQALLRAERCGPLALGQLIALKVEDVDLARATLRARGRGGRRTTVEMGPALVAEISTAIEGRESGPVFLSHTGLGCTASIAATAYATVRDRVGIDRRVKLFGRVNDRPSQKRKRNAS